MGNVFIITRALKECPERKLPIKLSKKHLNLRIQRVGKKCVERDKSRVVADSSFFREIQRS